MLALARELGLIKQAEPKSKAEEKKSLAKLKASMARRGHDVSGFEVDKGK